MASSEVDICNLALGLLGADRISSLSEDDNCYIHYPLCRDACLEAVDWSFALTRVAISTTDATSPAFGYANRFLIPANILRVIEVNGNEYEWVIEGEYILTDEATVEILAIRRVTDVRQYSQAFTMMLAALLASTLAIPITNSKSMVEAALALYSQRKQEAQAGDGRQGSNKRIVRKDVRLRHTI